MGVHRNCFILLKLKRKYPFAIILKLYISDRQLARFVVWCAKCYATNVLAWNESDKCNCEINQAMII